MKTNGFCQKNEHWQRSYQNNYPETSPAEMSDVLGIPTCSLQNVAFHSVVICCPILLFTIFFHMCKTYVLFSFDALQL